MPAEETDFSASNSALGYLYQCRLALWLALSRLRSGTEFQVSIETLDDVTFEPHGDPAELLQAKHHSKPGNLTDASPDIWKTLRIWSEQTKKKKLPENALLFIVTTATAQAGSAAGCLKSADRNVTTALQKLRATAATSSNEKNKPGIAAFNALDDAEQEDLLDRIYVLDLTPTIVGLDAELKKEVYWAVDRRFLESFLTRLEGWWYRRVILQLTGTALPILSDEIEDQMNDLREQFKADSLPIDDDIFDAEIDDSIYSGAPFIQQLHLLGIATQRILIAVREYYRAYEQRSRWLREELLDAGELRKYERRLKDEWQLMFARMQDELGDEAAEDVKRAAAQNLYKWVETSVFPIRDNVKEPSITRGSYHMLADKLKVGWHPDFLERLHHLLEPTEVK